MVRGPFGEGRVRLVGRQEEADPRPSVTDKQYRQRALPFFRQALGRNDSMGSVVLAASSSARASLFARYGSQPWASYRPTPRSRLVLRRNPPRHPFPPICIVPAEPTIGVGLIVPRGTLDWNYSLAGRLRA